MVGSQSGGVNPVGGLCLGGSSRFAVIIRSLQGVHELTITTNGWVHTQQNQKVSLGKEGQVSIVGQELGVNRYERISEPSLMAAETTWEKTGEYWKDVREAWVEVYQKHPAFSLKIGGRWEEALPTSLWLRDEA